MAGFTKLFDSIIWHILRTRLFNSIRPKLIRSELYLIEGKTRFSDSPISVAILGSKISVEYFSKFFYTNIAKINALVKVSLSDVSSGLGTVSADLVIVESNWFFSRFLADNGFFLSPRVDFVLDIDDSLENIQNRANEGKRRRLRQVVEAGYSFEVTRDLSKLRSFYYDVYLPHMLRRHSKYALPIGFSECLDLFSKGVLLLVKSGEELVSGNLLVRNDHELWQPILAVKDVDNKLTLGSYAVYYFSIIVGIEQGYKRIDFGEAPPFIQDGVFRFKKGLGMWARPAREDSAQLFGIKFSGNSQFGKNFLSANPFVFMDKENFCGLVFLESVDDLSVKPLYIPGLVSLYVISSSIDVHDLKCYKVEKLSIEECLHNTTSALRLMGKICVEGKHSLYRITK